MYTQQKSWLIPKKGRVTELENKFIETNTFHSSPSSSNLIPYYIKLIYSNFWKFCFARFIRLASKFLEKENSENSKYCESFNH